MTKSSISCWGVSIVLFSVFNGISLATEAPLLHGVPADIILPCGSSLPAVPTVTAQDRCESSGMVGRWNDVRNSASADAVNRYFVIEWDGLIGAVPNTHVNSSNGHTYQVVSSNVSWSTASNLARVVYNNLTGHLATVTSAQENAFIVSILHSGVAAAFLGGTDAGSEGTWSWITGEPFVYQAWLAGEPNNYQGNEHYLAILGPFWSSTSPVALSVSYEQTGSLTGCPAVITRTWSATGSCGTVTSATQTIQIEPGIDEEPDLPPLLHGVPADVILPCGSSLPAVPTVTAQDRCESSGMVGRWNDVRNSASADAVNRYFVIEWDGLIGAVPNTHVNSSNGHTYQVVSSNVSWSTASNLARVVYNNLTGHLATVTSAQENAFIVSILPAGVAAAFLGGTDAGSEGTWSWITGEPFVYQAWLAGEPNNYQGNEHYLAILGPFWSSTSPVALTVSYEQTGSLTGCPAVITRTWSATGSCGTVTSATQTIQLEPDTDGDGLMDWEEILIYGTNPNIADTDGDGLSDGDEVRVYGTNPLVKDTDGDGFSDGWEVRVGTDPLDADDSPAAAVLNDYDGDEISDMAVFRPSTGQWYIRRVAGGPAIVFGANWGGPGVIPVMGDYNGDGLADAAVFSPAAGRWYIRDFAATNTIAWNVNWGTANMIPVPGDYNGDNVYDLAMYQPSTGNWYIRNLADGPAILFASNWGGPGMIPVAGDYDGDGVYDLAVYRPSTGQWYIRKVTGEVIRFGTSWGSSSMIPVSGDYDGDGYFDLAMYDQSAGRWHIRSGRTMAVLGLHIPWGGAGMVATSGDFNGDGIYDLPLYQESTGRWYILNLSKGALIVFGAQWGGVGFEPVGVKR